MFRKPPSTPVGPFTDIGPLPTFLTRPLFRDVIDVEPADGNILKMVMGSLDDIWDEKPHSLRGHQPPGSGSIEFRG